MTTVSTLPETVRRVRAARAEGARIVFTNGCFDLLHVGHLDLLERARALGDLLVVGVNGDASVRRLKGAGRPLTPFDDRARLLAALAVVDVVVGFDDDTPLALIRAVEPDVLVKGGDWPPDRIVGREVVEARGGEVRSLPLLAGHSTTALVDRLRGSGSR
jgi:rfaE bifunctional protein nucleotidyltransferase chain/domain